MQILVSASQGFKCNPDVYEGLLTLAQHVAYLKNIEDGLEPVPADIVDEVIDEREEKKVVKKKTAKKKTTKK